MISNEEKYMQRCVDLALLGAGSVSPNPMVGAVIVWEDRIIGEGYHQQYGQAHAEVNAIRSVFQNFTDAEKRLKESVIYVSLEPCAHFGKTPPCADLIIRHQIPHVVIGSPDPFEQVNGRGVQKLKDAGIQVKENVLRDRCDFINRRFFTRIRKQRPYIILKWAQTSDGYFAPRDGSQRWITSPVSRALVHRWRSEEDAVLVGKKTALIDNPQLNVREWTGRNPLRMIIDRHLQLPPTLHLFDQSQPTVIFNEVKTDVEGRINYIAIEDFDHYLPQMLAYQLYLLDIQSVIVEGGAHTLNLFLKAGLWDEARVFSGPQFWGDGLPAPWIAQTPYEVHDVGPDKLEIFFKTQKT